MSLEFEIPLVSLIFTIILTIVYFLKPKINLIENKYFESILISSLSYMIIDTTIHFICSINDFSVILSTYYPLFNFLNKVLVTLFVIIVSSMLSYILIISYENVRKNNKVVKYSLIAFIILFALSTLFTNIKLVKVGYVINVTGSTASWAYVMIAIILSICLIISLVNIKKIDKRYFPIFLILPLMGLFYLLTIAFPGMIIYDLTLALLCYIMFFTIENPDLKMINELNIAKDVAEKANNFKTEFLSNMSHEIRTPLNAIVGFSQSLTEEDLPDSAKESIKDIVIASDNLLEIVNSILDISKIEANKIEIVNTDYDTEVLIDELIALTKGRLIGKSLDFKTSFDSSLPKYLHGDHQRLKQIIINLLTNSVKYTKEGYIEFKINCIQKNNICRLIISVEDSGMGIKPEKIDKLFTKFERLDVQNNTTAEGTGLGLAITKKLVELMGGKIVCQSVYGKGSRFTVAVNQRVVIGSPNITNQSSKVKPNLEIKNIDYSHKKLLVVDDNVVNLKVASKLLQPYKIQITETTNGAECLELIAKGHKYDLIFMDDMMPKMKGTEVLIKLKEDPDFNIPVVALTANAISGMREKYLSEGFNDYLAKPIDRSELDRVLKRFLDKDK